MGIRYRVTINILYLHQHMLSSFGIGTIKMNEEKKSVLFQTFKYMFLNRDYKMQVLN